MAISLPNPVVIPQQTFESLAILDLGIDWPDLNGPVVATYRLGTFHTNDDGSILGGPDIGSRSIVDVYAVAAQRAAAGKPALATALQAVLAALVEYETDSGTFGKT